MISLLGDIYSMFNEKEMYTLLLVGPNGCGKTSLFYMLKKIYMKIPLPKTIPKTMGLNVCNFVYKRKVIRVWDVCGDKDMRSLWKNYLKLADCIIFLSVGINEMKDTNPDETRDALDMVLEIIDPRQLIFAINKFSTDIIDFRGIIGPDTSFIMDILEISTNTGEGISHLLSKAVEVSAGTRNEKKE